MTNFKIGTQGIFRVSCSIINVNELVGVRVNRTLIEVEVGLLKITTKVGEKSCIILLYVYNSH